MKKLNYEYDSNSVEEMKEEVYNEITGIMNCLKSEYSESDTTYLTNLVEDFKTLIQEVEVVQTKTVKRLSHRAFGKAMDKELNIETEHFNNGEVERAETFNGSTYYPIVCNRNVWSNEKKLEFALWINYTERKIIVEVENENATFTKLVNKYYANKGYELTIEVKSISI